MYCPAFCPMAISQQSTVLHTKHYRERCLLVYCRVDCGIRLDSWQKKQKFYYSTVCVELYSTVQCDPAQCIPLHCGIAHISCSTVGRSTKASIGILRFQSTTSYHTILDGVVRYRIIPSNNPLYCNMLHYGEFNSFVQHSTV